MSTTASKLLGAVVRLVAREAGSWKAAGGASGTGGAGGGASSTSASAVVEAKNEAESELQKLGSSELAARRAHSGVRAALDGGIDALFKSFCDPMILEAVTPALLADSATLVILTMIRAASKGSPSAFGENELTSGGYLASRVITASFSFFKRAKDHEVGVATYKMVALIKYFVFEVLEKAWGIDDVWGDVELGHRLYSPLEAAAKAGSLPLVLAALDNGRTADVTIATHAAYCEGHPAVFDFLTRREVCLKSNGRALVNGLFNNLGSRSDGVLWEQREEMLDKFLRRWPQVIHTSWPSTHDPTCQRALEAATSARSVKLVNTVLSLGSPIQYEKSEVVSEGITYVDCPTVSYALLSPSLPIMKLLVEFGAFEDWQTKYSEESVNSLDVGFCISLLSCYPPPKPSDRRPNEIYQPDGLETFALVLSTGFRPPSWRIDEDGQIVNLCLTTLLAHPEAPMSEEHIIDLLSRCKAAGMDIVHKRKEDVGKHHGQALAVMAAQAGLPKLLDFAIEVQGPGSFDSWHTDGGSVGTTPLLQAIKRRRLKAVQHLLHVYKAEAAYRTDGPNLVAADHQPIMEALALGDDETALPYVRELIRADEARQLMRADPSLCDLDCFRKQTADNPVMLCCNNYLPKCLEAILSVNLPGVEEMCSKSVRTARSNGTFVEYIPADVLAAFGRWDMLAMLLQYCPDAPVTVPGKVLRADGTLLEQLPTVLENAERRRAPRGLLLKLKTMAKQQRADAEKAKVIAANSAIPSNAFEDVTNKVLTEAQEKKKAKKRSQKKKAKAKKRAAAASNDAAHAGAGMEEESSSDSDSSGPDEEEEGMDEEERMLARAPTFDLEKERATRKVRAEAEKAKETKE
jgi:hypothetical protein